MEVEGKVDLCFLRQDIGLGEKQSEKIIGLIEILSNHSVFQKVIDLQTLHIFMGVHVFAVWDFMSLLKRLQRDLTCTDIPWLPPRNTLAARLINEIALQEETDLTADGQGFASHFEIYKIAMTQIGADTAPIERFLENIRSSKSFCSASLSDAVKPPARDFVLHNLKTAMYGSTVQALASFVLAREEIIPAMFQSLLDANPSLGRISPSLLYYLERHISVDSKIHGPIGWQITAQILGEELARKDEFADAAISALEERKKLWDGLQSALT